MRGVVNKWFENYLKDITQFVNFDDSDSAKRQIICGVPHGSILGPLLYLIYVNDIAKACDSNIYSFADDTTVVLSHSNLQTRCGNANCHMHELHTWFCANKLSLNAGKTKYIVNRPKQRKCKFDNLKLEIKGMPLQRIGEEGPEQSTNFPGIYLVNLYIGNPISVTSIPGYPELYLL